MVFGNNSIDRRRFFSILLGLGLCLFTRQGFSLPDEKDVPHRIISLGSTITEGLYLLGAGDRIIGDTVYCVRPPEAGNKEKVGSIIDADVEKIVSLEPDIVLATSLTDAKAKEKLKNLGIRVVTLPAPKTFLELCAQFVELGEIVGRADEAKSIVTLAQKEVAGLRKDIENLPRPKVFMQMGASPLFAVTKGYFLNDFIEFAGGINIARDAQSGIYSREEVLSRNPEVILITTMGILGEKEKETWLKFKSLQAVKNNRIYIVDEYKFCSPTPPGFAKALKELIGILHE